MTVAPTDEPDEIDEMIDEILYGADPSLHRFARAARTQQSCDTGGEETSLQYRSGGTSPDQRQQQGGSAAAHAAGAGVVLASEIVVVAQAGEDGHATSV